MSQGGRRKGKYKTVRLNKETKIATWNLHGKLEQQIQRELLVGDMKTRKIDIACLQETRWREDAEVYEGGGTIFNFAGQDENKYKRYGMGFYVSNRWRNRIIGATRINDRIAIIQLQIHQNDKKRLTIINVYSPTSVKAERGDTNPIEEFYSKLHETIAEYKRTSYVTIVAGDFNAKIGQQSEEDKEIMGRYSKGFRNTHGQYLSNFLREQKLLLANTVFKHKDHHIATWHSTIRKVVNGQEIPYGIHNQIDYIAIQQRHKIMVNDARVYQGVSGLKYESDHGMVVMRMKLKVIYLMTHRKYKQRPPRKDIQQLFQDDKVAEKFKEYVSREINMKDGERRNNETPQLKYDLLTKILKKAEEEIIPNLPAQKFGKMQYMDDEIIRDLAKQRQLLRTKYTNTSMSKIEKRRQIQTKRSQLLLQMKKRIKKLNGEKIDGIAEVIEENKGNRKMFEYARMLTKNKKTRYKIIDDEGFTQSDPNKTIKTTTEHYKAFFNKQGETEIPAWRGEPRPLTNPITTEEVENAIKRLNRHRATGPDGLSGELFKGGGPIVVEYITEMLNEMFELHSEIAEINQGYLFPINKDKGPKTAQNTRAITLLNMVRKILSDILRVRMLDEIENYLPENQYAYRAGRNSTSITWAIQTLKATTERFKERYDTTSIDLSTAFDRMLRGELLQIFEVNRLAKDEDEMRMLQYLLSNTNLRVKVNQDIGDAFATNVGTPQGDALSPILFIVYLEHIMRQINQQHGMRNRREDFTIHFADDTKFLHHARDIEESHPEEFMVDCDCNKCAQFHLQQVLPVEFMRYNMKMNVEKTKFGIIQRAVKSTQKAVFNKAVFVGSQIEAEAEVKLRIAKADAAFFATYRLWIKGNNISVKTKLRLYNALIRPHLMYNMAAIPLVKTQKERLDRANRRQLRMLMGYYYDKMRPIVSVMEIYTQTDLVPISVSIALQRWTLLGHMLRQSEATPHFRAMKLYFKHTLQHPAHERKSYMGAYITSTITMIDAEYRLAEEHIKKAVNIDKIGDENQLYRLRNYASNRREWRQLSHNIASKVLRGWNKNYREKKQEVFISPARDSRGRVRRLTAQQRGVIPRILQYT